LVDRGLIEAGQPLEAGGRDHPLASFIGAEDRRLELGVRRLLDVEQRQALARPYRSQPGPQSFGERALVPVLPAEPAVALPSHPQPSSPVSSTDPHDPSRSNYAE